MIASVSASDVRSNVQDHRDQKLIPARSQLVASANCRHFRYTDRKPRLRACTIITAFILFSETSMALFKLPLSGDVVQWINPVTWFMSGNQISTNVYLGESSAPEVEAEILDRVGTYGRQLGQITDAMIVLLRHLPDRESLTRKESDVIKAFEKMANEIANIKEKHKRQAVRP
jgi:hypothetical protein